jgi:signal transduction histidine kinase
MHLKLFFLFVYSNSSYLLIIGLLLIISLLGFTVFWFRSHHLRLEESRQKTRRDDQKTGFPLEKCIPQLEMLLSGSTEKFPLVSGLFMEVYMNSSDAITFIEILDNGRKLRIIDMNPIARKLSGLSPEKLNKGILADQVMPEDNYRHFIKDILPAVLEGKPVTYVEEWDMGRSYWEASVYPLVDHSGKVSRLAVFSRNITAEHEQKRISAILQSVIDSRPIDFCACDDSGNVIFQNQMSRERYGDLIGKRLKDSNFPIDVEARREVITRSVIKGETIIFEGSEMVSGQKRYFSYRLMPIITDKAICGYTYAAIDITEPKQHDKELLQSVVDTEEKERLHFSQELHDGLGPLLSAAKLYTGLLTSPTKEIDIAAITKGIHNLLEESTNTLKDISFKLSPHILKSYGIAEALVSYSEKVGKSCCTKISINHTTIPRLDDLTETVIYRVVCECINNTLRHADAGNIGIGLQMSDNELLVNYSDDGKGFDLDRILLERKGIGLLNIKSRLKSINAQFSMESALGDGFKMSIKIPL